MSEIFLAELPGVWLDPLTVVASVGGRIQVVNRNPEPGETDVPPVGLLDLCLFDTGGVGIDAAQTKVFVSGALAFDGSLGSPFQPGFDGPNKTTATAGSGGLRVALDKASPAFSSLEIVSIRVVSATTDGLATIDTIWTFTVSDTSTPMLVHSSAPSLSTVLVRFNKVVRQVGDGAAQDALTAANYELGTATVPAVTPAATSVRAVSSTEVELTVSPVLSPRATYTVTARRVEDLAGHAAPSQGTAAMFTAPTLPSPAGRVFDLYRMLPLQNRRQDSDGLRELERFIRCIQEITDFKLFDIDTWTDILDPDLAPERYLDAMLLDLGNPFKFELSVEDKRRLVRILVPLYKQKGTAPGIANVVRFFLGLEVQVVPFSSHGMTLGESDLGSDGTDGSWELGADGSFAAYAFDVSVDVVLTPAQRERLTALVRYMKPAHTHFVRLLEPVAPTIIDHVELGISELGVTWDLH